MKKLLSSLLLIIITGLFASCQKGENFFAGTWQAIDEYKYTLNNKVYYDIYTVEVTLAKKDGSATLTINYPKVPKDNVYRTGTYTFYNDNTIAITFNETKNYNEEIWIAYKSDLDDRIYIGGVAFTKIKK